MAPSFARIWTSTEQAVLGRWSQHPGPTRPTSDWNGHRQKWSMAAGKMEARVTLTVQRAAVVPAGRRQARHWVASLAAELAVSREGEGGEGRYEAEEEEGIDKLLRKIRSSSSSSGNPYDGAWVAMVPALDGSVRPQFHAALNWVRGSQLPDGSWAGDWKMWDIHDRLLCTLACVLALATWSRAKDAVHRGCSFISARLHEVDSEQVRATLGFEMVVSALVERAQVLRLELPYHAPAMAAILEERERKLQQLPLEHRHLHPSPLLGSLEGLQKLPGLEWWMRLKAPGGAMASALPGFSSLMDASDGNCHSVEHLVQLADEFKGELPDLSPVELLERLWVVEKLHSLGVARYCHLEIRDFLTGAGRQQGPPGVSPLNEAAQA